MHQNLIPSAVSDTFSNLASCDVASCSIQNVGMTERAISALGGAVISLYGINRGGLGGLVIAAIGGSLVYRGITGNCQMYRALGISTNERSPYAPTGVPALYGFKYEKNFVINRPAHELYDHWRRLENLPRIMSHLQSVTQLDSLRSRWVAKGPMGVQLEWDAEIMNEDPGRLIAWRSLPGAQVDTAGSVHFEELSDGRGTELRVSLKYNPPGGKVGAGIAWLMGSSVEQEVEEDMRRFKQAMEAGQLPVIQGQPSSDTRL